MKTILSFYLICGSFLLSAQNLESIAKGDVLKGSGGLSFNQIYNQARGKQASRNPYTYVLSGNINFQILGFINAPFNFMYSNLGNAYTQPTFNQTSIHPNYKWVSTHFGAISSNYSPYTVNGHLFKGAAVDLTPGKFSFNVFYGCFQKAVNPEMMPGVIGINPAYKRMGEGFKIGFNDHRFGTWGLMMFSAKDQINSLPVLSIPESIAPKQNLNAGLQVQKTFLRKLTAKADVAFSLFTEDLRAKQSKSVLPAWLYIRHANNTTALYKAFKTGLSYSVGKGSVNLSYERIDPFYKTLGAYYFNNDMENITAGFSANLMKQKFQINVNSGLQRDNVLKTKLSTMNRLASNVYLNFKPTAKFNLSMNYSDFLSYSNLRPFTDYQFQLSPYRQWDTLNYRQISRNVSGNMYLLLHADSLFNSSLTTCLTYQNAADKQGEKIKNGNAFYNFNIGYQISKIKTGGTLMIAFNAGQTMMNESRLLNVSPVLNLSQPLFNKKLRPGVSLCYTNSIINHSSSGAVINLRGSISYTFHKVHNFSFSFLVLSRKDFPASSLYTRTQHFVESTVSFCYSVNMEFFDLKKRLSKT